MRIAFYLGNQVLMCSAGIVLCAMCPLEILVTIKLVSCTKCSLLHLMKNMLNIDELSSFHVKLRSRTEKLLHQQLNIETIGTISTEITTIQHLFQLMCHLFESGSI